MGSNYRDLVLDRAYQNWWAGRAEYPTPRKKGLNDLMHPLIPRLCFLGKENLAARLSFA
jgi:hypothetical protein